MGKWMFRSYWMLIGTLLLLLADLSATKLLAAAEPHTVSNIERELADTVPYRAKETTTGGTLFFIKRGKYVVGIYGQITISCFQGVLTDNLISASKEMYMEFNIKTQEISIGKPWTWTCCREFHPDTSLLRFPSDLSAPEWSGTYRMNDYLKVCLSYFDDGTQSDGDQRDKARLLACSAPSGSLGKEAICPNFDYWYVKAFGNLCAGQVGNLYENNTKSLEEPATDENIENWAGMETIYFQEQGGCTALLGSLLSRTDRIQRMKEARDKGKLRK